MPNPEISAGILNQFSISEIISALLQTSFLQKAGFAAWRQPNQKAIFISISFEHQEIPENFKVESADPGFLMHPFEVSGKNKAWYLKTSFLFTGKLEEEKITLLAATEKSMEVMDFWAKFEDQLTSGNNVNSWFTLATAPESATKLSFENLVQNGIHFLQKGGAEKVVLSRASQKNLPLHFSPVSGFLNLTRQYEHAFVSLVSTPETGTWLGASPEILVLKDRQNIFRTMALAGTQKLAAGLKPANAIWRQKEIEEQSMVVRYIISCFKKIRLRDYLETGPRTVAAGNLLHLRSDFCYDLSKGEFPNLTSEMLALLHPTSAVCGQPKEAALEFIRKHENYNRRYYSGYLGPVNVLQETNLYVNLRCLELRENTAILYAGAGITSDSEPEKEWQETELKMQTVSAALHIVNTHDDTATGY